MTEPKPRRPMFGKWKRDFLAVRDDEESARFWEYIHSNQPSFKTAIAADVRVTAARRGERHSYQSTVDLVLQAIRLMFVTEAFFAQVCYRAKVECRRRGIPIAPVLLDRMSILWASVSICDSAIIGPGLYIPHGQIVVSGVTRIGRGAYLSPWSGIALVSGNVLGATIGDHFMLGIGATALGPVNIGDHVTVGAHALVLHDLPDGATAIGVPARQVGPEISTG